MVYKLIACDVDETLLDDFHNCPQVNIDAIAKARMQGVKFVLASGRGFGVMQNQLDMLGLKDVDNEYTISFNGGAITENKGNKILSMDCMDYKKVKSLFDFGIERGLCIHIYTPEQIYVFNMDDVEYEHLLSKGIPVERVLENDITFLKEDTLIKILYFSLDLAYLKSLEQPISSLLENVELTYSSNRFMEFNLKGIHKGYGVEKLAKILNISMDEVMVIGDNDNDVSMMKVAGLSVAAGNASKPIQDICHYVTKVSNNEGVVAEAINKFVLNEDV